MAKTDDAPTKKKKAKKAAGTKSKSKVEEVGKDARQWAMFCHLAGLAWMTWLLPVIGGVVAVLIIWHLKRDDDPFIDENGRRAINFQLSMLIYFAASGLLCFVIIGLLLVPVVIVLNIIFTIIAAIKAGDGKYYKYPLSIKFIKRNRQFRVTYFMYDLVFWYASPTLPNEFL